MFQLIRVGIGFVLAVYVVLYTFLFLIPPLISAAIVATIGLGGYKLYTYQIKGFKGFTKT